jgi:hypothetical protein
MIEHAIGSNIFAAAEEALAISTSNEISQGNYWKFVFQEQHLHQEFKTSHSYALSKLKCSTQQIIATNK